MSEMKTVTAGPARNKRNPEFRAAGIACPIRADPRPSAVGGNSEGFTADVADRRGGERPTAGQTQADAALADWGGGFRAGFMMVERAPSGGGGGWGSPPRLSEHAARWL
jgi:hypothetical protein